MFAGSFFMPHLGIPHGEIKRDSFPSISFHSLLRVVTALGFSNKKPVQPGAGNTGGFTGSVARALPGLYSHSKVLLSACAIPKLNQYYTKDQFKPYFFRV